MTRQTQVSTDRDIEAGFGQVRGRRPRGIPRYYAIQAGGRTSSCFASHGETLDRKR